MSINPVVHEHPFEKSLLVSEHVVQFEDIAEHFSH